MNHTKIAFLYLLACVFTIVACKKDPPPRVVEDDFSIDGGWSLTNIDTNLDEQAESIAASVPVADLGGITPELYIQFLMSQAHDVENLEDCRKDDAYLFFRNGLVGFENGGSVCEAGAAADSDAIIPDDASWVITNDEDLLIMLAGGDKTTYTIITLTDDTLELETREQFMDTTLNITTDDVIVVRYSFKANS